MKRKSLSYGLVIFIKMDRALNRQETQTQIIEMTFKTLPLVICAFAFTGCESRENKYIRIQNEITDLQIQRATVVKQRDSLIALDKINLELTSEISTLELTPGEETLLDGWISTYDEFVAGTLDKPSTAEFWAYMQADERWPTAWEGTTNEEKRELMKELQSKKEEYRSIVQGQIRDGEKKMQDPIYLNYMKQIESLDREIRKRRVVLNAMEKT